MRRDEINMKLLIIIIIVTLTSFCSMREQGEVILQEREKNLEWIPTLLR
jgi:hypothetical protein